MSHGREVSNDWQIDLLKFSSSLLTRIILIRNDRESISRVGFLDPLCFSGMVEAKVIRLSQADHTTCKTIQSVRKCYVAWHAWQSVSYEHAMEMIMITQRASSETICIMETNAQQRIRNYDYKTRGKTNMAGWRSKKKNCKDPSLNGLKWSFDSLWSCEEDKSENSLSTSKRK